MNLSNPKIKLSITGAGGFLGSAAVDFFSQLPEIAEVRALYSTQPQSTLSAKVKPLVGDLKNPLVCDTLSHEADCIIHLAHRGFPSDREKSARKTISDNVAATSELLQSMQRNQAKRLIYASSGGAVYLEDEKKKPFKENASTVFRTPYAASKLINEYVIREFAQTYPLDATVFRISNPYGIGQLNRTQQGIVGVLLGKILRKERLTLWSSPQIVKDFIYIDDVLSAFHRVVNSSRPITGLFNIGSSQGLSLSELFKVIEKVTGEPTPIDFNLNPVPECSWTVLDCSKFFQATGWKCQTQMEQGVRMLWKALNQTHQKQAA